jgi:two-component system sensor histidine kinase SenX3
VTPTTEALVLAVLGAVLGGGVVLAWHVSERQQRGDRSVEPVLPPAISTVLSALRSSALVMDAEDVVLKASAPAVAMGLVHGDHLVVPELGELVAQVRRDGEIRETELVLRRPGRPPRHVSARVAPLGSRLVLALVEDRTRDRRVEAIRRDFVANVSHELKTPVGAIRLLADAVLDAADDPAAVQRFAGRMHAESDRLARLVQQIIELSRLQGDDPLDEPVPVSVDDVVERARDELATDAEVRRVSVLREGDHDLVVLGNADQISLALNNLVANAVAYSPEGATVVIGVRATGETVEIRVTDQGPGIPPDELDRIFERFYRVDPARGRSTGGTGLGLSIVKHVVASHGGEVRVWSAEGDGSTFTLELPRARPPAGSPASASKELS